MIHHETSIQGCFKEEMTFHHQKTKLKHLDYTMGSSKDKELSVITCLTFVVYNMSAIDVQGKYVTGRVNKKMPLSFIPSKHKKIVIHNIWKLRK